MPAAGLDGQKTAAPGQARTGPGDGNRALEARLLEWDTPTGVCEYAWLGDLSLIHI